MKDVSAVVTVAECAKFDLLAKCMEFPYPETLKGIKPKLFDDISFGELTEMWDETNSDNLIKLINEFMLFPVQKMYKTIETFNKVWLPKCPLINFYRFMGETLNRIGNTKKLFSELKINLTEEEKAAGYGAEGMDSKITMLFAYSTRMGIDVREAEKIPWPIIYTYFKIEIDDANRQRKLNDIILEKSKKK